MHSSISVIRCSSKSLPVRRRESYVSENATAAQKIRKLKNDIKTHCRVKEYFRPDDAFGQAVLEDLWAAIAAEYPEEESPLDELAAERSYHEAFIEGRSQRFIGRRDLLNRLTEYAGERNSELLALTGAPGCGKSALLANFAHVYAGDHPEAFVLAHFIGASSGSTDIRRTLLRLSGELVRRFKLTEDIPEEYEGLRAAFGRILTQAAASGTQIVLIVDALDQLAEPNRARSLDWLPYGLPSDVRLIVSTLEGECLEALRCRHPEPEEIIVGPLDEAARSEIVNRTLWDYRKKLDEKQMRLLLGKQQSESPLYLTVVCEELRVFGEFERVTERIARLPDDVPVLFQQLLERLEHDHGRELVRNALSLLACSRHGLLESEVLELLRRDSEPQLPHVLWARLYRSLQFYLRPPGETGEGELNFFHQQLAEAVRERYLISKDSEIAAHRKLEGYFRRKADPAADATWSGDYARGFSELPHHQTCARMWERLSATLYDFGFIHAKCSAQMTYDLLDDYGVAIEALSGLTDAGADHPQPHETLGVIEGAIQLSAHVLARDADQLAGQLLGRLQAQDTSGHRSLLDAAMRWRGMPWLRPRTGSLTPPGEPLVRTRMLTGHSEGVSAVAITPGGRLVISAGFYDHALKVREVASGLELMTLNSGGAPVAVTPDGRLAISGSSTFSDHALKVWDVASGQELRTLAGHTDTVRAVAVTPDGRLAISSSSDLCIRVWDVAGGRELRTLGPAARRLQSRPTGGWHFEFS